jgi:hypothetical protein
MKNLLFFLCLFSFGAWAQDPAAYLGKFDARVYSLRTKGVADLVVDIKNPKLTQQLNEQAVYGKVKELVFRLYWTSNPERIALEVLGLPEGFKEVKEELKASISPFIDYLLPQPLAKRFPGYKFTSGVANTFIAQDTSGVAPIPSYILKFSSEEKLLEIEAKKNIGTLIITPLYEKQSFSDSRWVLKEQASVSSENGQSLMSKIKTNYATVQGMGVLSELKITTEQKSLDSKIKPLLMEDSVTFSNYKINAGDALKYFLKDQ